MKISGAETSVVEVPLPAPVTTAIHAIRSVGCVLLRLRSDQGISGESYAFTLNAQRLQSLHEMLRGFLPLLEGKSPHQVTAIAQSIWREMNPTGYQGFSVAALSLVDTACWDLVGKAAEQPLHHLFGGCRNRVKTYASGGLWLGQSPAQCATQAAQFVESGFRGMKIRVGNPDLSTDIARVRAVREAVGEEIELLADANQALGVKQAIRLGKALAEYQIGWLEEPVSYLDAEGCAEVRAALAIDVAGGESCYTRYGMRELVDARAVDVLMPDLQRVGGFSEIRRVAALAFSRDIPISTHFFTEYSLSIAGSEPNCVSVEHIPWFAPLFNEQLELIDGELVIPERPGTGFTFNADAIAKFAL